MSEPLSRRQAIALVGAVPLAALATSSATARQPTTARRWPIGLVSRHVQWTGLEDAIAVARAAGETASGLGIKVYRSGEYFRYDYARDVWQQLEDLKPRVAGLAALNDTHGTQVAYHTHSGAGLIGGNVWDFWEVIRGFEPRLVGLNYDIGHATARGGAGWFEGASLVARHISAFAIKDVEWERTDRGWRSEFCPIGEGMIDLKRMFALLDRTGFTGPVNIHYEHSNLLGTDLGTWQLPIPRQRFIEIVSKDLQFARSQMGAADGRTG